MAISDIAASERLLAGRLKTRMLKIRHDQNAAWVENVATRMHAFLFVKS